MKKINANGKANATKSTRARITNKEGLPQCFLNEGESYTWLAKGGIAVEQRLPYVAQKYEAVLKENGIPYRYAYIPDKYNKGEKYAVCEYWHPECPILDKILPVYIKAESAKNMYVFTGDYVTRYVVSGKTKHMAKKLEDTVKYECAKFDLEGKIATVVRRSKKMPMEVNLQGSDGGSIKMLQACNAQGEPTGICGIFDMNKVNEVHYVEVGVPEKMQGVVIGKAGKNKKSWDAALGGKNVIVVTK